MAKERPDSVEQSGRTGKRKAADDDDRGRSKDRCSDSNILNSAQKSGTSPAQSRDKSNGNAYPSPWKRSRSKVTRCCECTRFSTCSTVTKHGKVRCKCRREGRPCVACLPCEHGHCSNLAVCHATADGVSGTAAQSSSGPPQRQLSDYFCAAARSPSRSKSRSLSAASSGRKTDGADPGAAGSAGSKGTAKPSGGGSSDADGGISRTEEVDGRSLPKESGGDTSAGRSPSRSSSAASSGRKTDGRNVPACTQFTMARVSGEEPPSAGFT